MQRLRMIAYYEDRVSSTRVAQTVVVLEKDVPSAVQAVKAALASRAHGGHIIAVELKERDEVETGVVFTGEPYIPLHWPLTNRARSRPKRPGTQVLPSLPPIPGAESGAPAPPLPWTDDDPPETV